MNPYTEQLEHIIAEMKRAGPTVTASEYQQWLAFLRSIHPESQLLKKKTATKQLTDIREVMLLAESANYPVWYIQPKLTGIVVQAKYKEGLLQSVTSKQQTLEAKDLEGLPSNILEFSGTIKGTSSDRFIAFDVDVDLPFLQKMELLKNGGVATAEFVAFPTDRLPSISSSSLETFFHNYIQQASVRGDPVDGLVIISDVPLTDGATEFTRMVYKWQLNSENIF